LLSHTAGLSVHGFGGYPRNAAIPTLPEILNGTPPANSPPVRSLFEPGIRYRYSGGGITISQLITENVTRQPYDVYMRKNVLQPLGMTMSFFTQPPPESQQKYLATGYHANGEQVDTKYHVYPEQAAAGLWTNPTDLAKYIIATQLSLQGKSNKVLSQQMTRLRVTPYIDKYSAFGVFIEKHDGEKYFGHDGADAGFTATYKGSFDNGNGVVVMANSDNGGILNEVVNSVATVYGWKDFYQPVVKRALRLPDSLLDKYSGDYLLGKDTLTISRKGNNLYIEQNHNGQTPIYFFSASDFFSRDLPLEFKIESDKKGNVKDIHFNTGSGDLTASRL
jgi:CubicO group peptidase (beta-lactamase class C family)